MSTHNAYVDLWEEIARALGERQVKVRVPRMKKQWRNVRTVIDGHGKQIGQLTLNREQMIALKSTKSGQRLYRVHGAGWLLENKSHSTRGLGQVMPLNPEQAHDWLERNGWTVLAPDPAGPALDYTARSNEKIFIEQGTVHLNTESARGVKLVAEADRVEVTGWPVRATTIPATVLVEAAGTVPEIEVNNELSVIKNEAAQEEASARDEVLRTSGSQLAQEVMDMEDDLSSIVEVVETTSESTIIQ